MHVGGMHGGMYAMVEKGEGANGWLYIRPDAI